MRSRADAAPAYLYVPELGGSGEPVELSPEESHYVARVCRARPGDRATATDGRGTVASLELFEVGHRVRAVIESVERRERAARVAVWCGTPEGTRADWLIEKLAELGVETWQPITCRRGSWERGSSRAERWMRLAIAGMRQSQRAHLMEILDPIGLEEGLAGPVEGCDRWLASPLGSRAARPDRSRPMLGAIGPAGGFIDEELRLLEASGFQPISLSEGRLRTETAALAWTCWSMLA